MNLKDLTGQQFGMLYVLKFSHIENLKNGKSKRIWECKCECGNTVYVSTANLTTKHVQSCGCKYEYYNKINMRRDNMQGIYFSKSKNKYRARCQRYNKEYVLGYFDDIKDAQIIRTIADTFLYFDNFVKWVPNRRAILQIVKDTCYEENIDPLEFVETMYNYNTKDDCIDGLYIDRDLVTFIIEFAEACR